MAKIFRREWTSKGPLGKRVKHAAYGYTLTVNGKRERKFSSDWHTEAAALTGLNQRIQAIQSGDLTKRPEISLDALTERYLKHADSPALPLPLLRPYRVTPSSH